MFEFSVSGKRVYYDVSFTTSTAGPFADRQISLRASGNGSQGAPVLSKAGKYIIGKQNELVASLPSSVDITLHLFN